MSDFYLECHPNNTYRVSTPAIRLAPGPGTRPGDPTGQLMESTARDNAALVREFLTEVLAGGDIDALDIFLSDSAIEHQPVLEKESALDPTQPSVWRVLAGADVDITLEHVVAEQDMVAVRGTVRGAHSASLVDATANGRTFEISCAWFCRIREGRIAEIWSLPDGRALQREVRREHEHSEETRPS